MCQLKLGKRKDKKSEFEVYFHRNKIGILNQKSKVVIARKSKGKYFIFLTLFIFFNNCSYEILPEQKLAPYETNEEIEIKDGTCIIKLSNPLECPLRIWVQNKDKEISKYFQETNPITLEKKSDTLLFFPIKEKVQIEKMNYPSRYGDPKKEIDARKISLPFKLNSSYKITQGNNSNFSHHDDYSRYAIDFDLNTGDTICAVADGYIVGVIDRYSKGGKNKKWRDYANIITIYHPELNLFSQYVHLIKNGSLVKMGEKVKEHQPIGISGMTGFTDTEHLHFAMMKSVESTDGLNSIPIEFKEGYKGIELRKNDIVTKKK